jgi:L-fucose isomerase-like protein
MYYSENDPMGGGLSQFSSSSSSMLEWGANEHSLKHERSYGNKDEILSWITGVTAASRLRESALLLWGGTYGVKMEQLQDDIPKLKSFLIRDILSEDQYILVSRAEKIIKREPLRIKKFIEWIKNNGIKIIFDDKMLTEEALNKQVALLIASRDRLAELKDEDICGVSIKCQPEIYSEYGVDACTLPAFLPFPINEDGGQQIYPTVCEGDIKGLLSSLILFYMNPEVPPAFGDLVSVEDDYIEFANCGAGSIYWSANSCKPEEALKNVTALGNIHGVSGASFSYAGKKIDKVTVLRLTRVKGKYYAQLGVGKALDALPFLSNKLGSKNLEKHLGARWGKVVINLGVKAQNFVKVIGANHLSLTSGDYSKQIEYFCRQIGIDIVRIDDDKEMLDFYNSIRK